MKFFRQTKETKRKLSFFLALAMVISLLPVSPVAKAAKSRVRFFNKVANTEMVVESNDENVTGSAIIKLKAKDGYKFSSNSNIRVSTGSAAESHTDEKQIEIEPVTDGALTLSMSPVTYDSENTVATVKINNITEKIDILCVTGEVFEKEKTEYTVKINTSNIGSGFTFSAKAGNTSLATDGTANTVKKNTEVIFIIKPDTNAVFVTKPELKVNGGNALEWKLENGEYKATKTVQGDINAVISGGEILVVSNKVETSVSKDNAVTDESTKKEISEASVATTANKTQVIADVVKNITGSSVEVNYQNGKSEAEVLAALKDGSAKITTALTVKKVDDSTAKTQKESAKQKSDFKFSDSQIGQSFGKDKEAQKKTISALIDSGVVLDINLNSIIKQNATTMASIAMKELDGEVEITMSIPASIKTDKKGTYYVIRIHNDEMTIIPCSPAADGKISFRSNKFSTYIVTFKEGDVIPTPTPTGSGNGNNNGYIPGPGQSSSPSANPSTAPSTNPSGAPSANPSGAPSANPSGAPSANPSSAPSANPSGAPTDPTNAPTEPTKAPVNPTKKPSTSVKVGKKATISGSQYKVTAVKGTRTVQFTKGKKNAKKIVIPSTVKVSGKSYKVTTIAKNALKGNKKLTKLTIGANVKKIGANAFRGCSKLKSIIVKTKKLTKSKVGANAFKGINAKATVKVPKAKVKAYKKIVKAKGAGKNVKVKK